MIYDEQAKTRQLQQQVASLEQDQARLVSQRQTEIVELYRRQGLLNGHVDVTGLSREHILKEISATLSERKKLQAQVCYVYK